MLFTFNCGTGLIIVAQNITLNREQTKFHNKRNKLRFYTQKG